MKKFLKITGIVLGAIILLLLLLPIFFEDQLKGLVQNTINENLNAEVAFKDIDLSLFRNFPDATLAIEEFQVINNAPFEGDTLAYGEEVILQMSVMELFNSAGEAMNIDELIINNTLLNIKIDSLGNANYDIAVKNNAPVTDSTASSGFQFDMEHYEINNSEINYWDGGSKISLNVEELNHEGTGDFSAETSTLSTSSTALVSLAMDGSNFLERNKIALEADFKMDLENMKFTFLDNEAIINQLPLTFDGYVQVNEDNNEIDLTFQTPSSSFKNFLAIIPKEYSKSIEEVETSGDFIVKGSIAGIIDEVHIPKLDISIASENASFKYPDLPKSVEDITILAKIKNETGLAEDTYVNIEKLNFRIDQDVFSANGRLRNLTENMLVDMAVKGTINLANMEQAYPFELEQELNGVLTADLTTSFDMNSIENEQYQNVRSQGTASIRDFSYASPEIPNEIKVATAELNFQPGTIELENLVATTGKTDLSVSGTIQNLMGFLFTDQKLKGNFEASSEVFSVNDFMVAETTETTTAEGTEPTPTGEEAIRIPSFLDAELDFSADKVIYDNLVLENTQGNVSIANETATLNNVSSNLFNGNIAVNGSVSTQGAVPTFNMALDLKSIDIADSFQGLELLQNLAPIVEALRGQLTSHIELTGNLNDDLTPQLETIAGDALAEVLGAEVIPQETPLLAQLDSSLDFIDLDDLNLNNLRTHLTFNDGRVKVEPFDFTIKGINITASGSHGFDMSMNYSLVLDIPAEFLGSDIGNVLSQLSSQELQNTNVPLPIGITGTFQNPSINLNMEQAISSLTQDIVENQKENLKEKGVDILTGILSGDRAPTVKDSTVSPEESPVDSVAEPVDPIREAARNILGGILGGNKKKKDSI